ncbi:subclass B3 metallo-beta-lactamase [Aurantiacibacter rhizosphaerae]|uniref:Subclass B3 metallo-beta-lactamase n=1 Tax=Aurantiacibacter rhizosphaerae TaxID=2691582 RepID=A0A844XEP7_9SPHN|nr:subclass B3 metallo-beta-lactamase [Aurantiacibacter rhizosphaerae]MWV28223.1 subclass B3 metallo-beta-lactamase [Aurantiacibacter rhizosphaerae]
MSAKALAALAALGSALLTGCVAPQPPVPTASAATLAAARTNALPAADWAASCEDWDEWDKRAQPFRIHGNTYHVGTCGISAILVAGEDGHVLIDSGTRDGARVVLSNIRTLGFQPQNLRAVLTSHEHFDHVGGLWWINQNSGARVLTSPPALPVIETGIAAVDDPQFGMHPAMRPLAGSQVSAVTPGEPVTIAGLTFTPIATPGHTPGALTWQWESCDAADCRTVVYADSLSAVARDDYRFTDHPEYLQSYRDGITRLAQLDCDILLTPHPSASNMRDKLVAGDIGGGMDCAAYAADRLMRLEQRLELEAAQ